MALDKDSLKARMVAELTLATTALGIAILSPAQLDKICEALANATVDEIQQNAQVVVTGGSSAGTYQVT